MREVLGNCVVATSGAIADLGDAAESIAFERLLWNAERTAQAKAARLENYQTAKWAYGEEPPPDFEAFRDLSGAGLDAGLGAVVFAWKGDMVTEG